MHNEEDSDEEFEEEEEVENQVTQDVAKTTNAEMDSCDDSIQIFEISSSFSEDKVQEDSSNDETAKPGNNKENTEISAKKKKPVASTSSGRFYATRQTDRKMRSGNVASMRTTGREKLARRITKNIKKNVKTLVEPKPVGAKSTEDHLTMRGARRVANRSNENKISEVETRRLRSAVARQSNFRSKKHVEPTPKVTMLRKRPDNTLIERGRERRMK